MITTRFWKENKVNKKSWHLTKKTNNFHNTKLKNKSLKCSLLFQDMSLVPRHLFLLKQKKNSSKFYLKKSKLIISTKSILKIPKSKMSSLRCSDFFNCCIWNQHAWVYDCSFRNINIWTHEHANDAIFSWANQVSRP